MTHSRSIYMTFNFIARFASLHLYMSITRALTRTRTLKPATVGTLILRANMSSIPTFGFQERKASTEEDQLIQDVMQLYKLNPISSAYARYSENAVFHDPIGIAQNLKSIKAQFNSMPSIFSKVDVHGIKVLDNPEVKPPSVQFALSQTYTFKMGNSDKLVNSLITLKVDPATNQIIQHDEEWDGIKSSDGSDGFFGKLNELRKKATAKVIEVAADTRPIDQRK